MTIDEALTVTGVLPVVAELFLAGIIRPDGRFNPDLHGSRMQWDGRTGAYILATAEQTATGKTILITQDDVRNVQLAKAALYAGARLLMKKAGIDAVDRVVLAGAFGSYIDPQHAMILGLIPDCDLDKVYAVGNAAGDGARIALLNLEKRREAQAIARQVRYIETAVDADFQEAFVAAIHLPHAEDPFPHLQDVLPQTDPVERKPRNERRRRRLETEG